MLVSGQPLSPQLLSEIFARATQGDSYCTSLANQYKLALISVCLLSSTEKNKNIKNSSVSKLGNAYLE